MEEEGGSGAVSGVGGCGWTDVFADPRGSAGVVCVAAAVDGAGVSAASRVAAAEWVDTAGVAAAGVEAATASSFSGR